MNDLDELAYNYGLKRKRRFLIFKESDKELRLRIVREFYDHNRCPQMYLDYKTYRKYEEMCRKPTPKIDFKEIWNWLKRLGG